MSPRLKAFLLHLAGSAMVALLVVFLVFVLWYPAPMHVALGVTHIFLLLLLVDVVLGPLLTLLVYKVGKKSLVFDMAVILMLQLAALGYGLWTVTDSRPVWAVFSVDRFDLVQALEVDARQLHAARPEYQAVSWFGPRWVGAVGPDSVEDRNNLIFESAMGGSDIPQRPNLYRPLSDMADALRGKAQPLEELSNYNAREQVRAVLADWPEVDGWLPLKARVRSMVVLLNKQRAEVVAVVDLKPWDN